MLIFLSAILRIKSSFLPNILWHSIDYRLVFSLLLKTFLPVYWLILLFLCPFLKLSFANWSTHYRVISFFCLNWWWFAKHCWRYAGGLPVSAVPVLGDFSGRSRSSISSGPQIVQSETEYVESECCWVVVIGEIVGSGIKERGREKWVGRRVRA